MENLEHHLLGNLMRCNDDLIRIPFLTAEHFSDPALGQIFSDIRKMFEKGQLASPVTLKEHYPDSTKAIVQMFSISMGIGTKQMAENIYQLALRREAKKVYYEAIEALEGTDPDVNTEDLLSECSDKIIQIQSGSLAKSFISSQELAEQITNNLGKKLPCYATGVTPLDEAMLGGLFEKRTYCIAARPKGGKTMMLGTISGNLNRAGVKHAFIAAEMGGEQIYQRMLARELGRSAKAFITDNDDPAFKERVASVAVKDSNNLIFSDSPGVQFSQLKKLLEIAVYKHKIKGFILDYLQLVGGRGKGINDAEHQVNVAQWIAEFCKKHSVWALYAAQINREGSVRGSDGVIMAADQVYLQHKITEGIHQNGIYLEQIASRYTEVTDVGTEDYPLLEIHNTGTHIATKGE